MLAGLLVINVNLLNIIPFGAQVILGLHVTAKLKMRDEPCSKHLFLAYAHTPRHLTHQQTYLTRFVW